MARQKDPGKTHDFIERVRSSDEAISGPAIANAFLQGASPVQSLTSLLTTEDFELARRARRALYAIVRHATRPGAKKEARAVEESLLSILRDNSPTDRRQVLWLLSEIGNDASVAVVAQCLYNPELREDARCALMRIPGRKSVAALRAALPRVDAEFRPALADALRKRGEMVTGYPSLSRVPCKQTAVTTAPGATR